MWPFLGSMSLITAGSRDGPITCTVTPGSGGGTKELFLASRSGRNRLTGLLGGPPDENRLLTSVRKTLDRAYLVTWAVKDSMIARGYGRIVNMTSISALDPRPMSIASDWICTVRHSTFELQAYAVESAPVVLSTPGPGTTR